MKNIPCRYFLLTLAIIAVYSGLAVHTALFAPLDSAVYLFSENGPYEFFSPWLWYALAALCLLSRTLASPTRQVAALTALMMGMREMDLHKALFEISFLKSRFYTDGNIALSHKLVGLALIVLLLGLLVYLAKTFYQALKSSDKPLPLSFRYTMLAVCAIGGQQISRPPQRPNQRLIPYPTASPHGRCDSGAGRKHGNAGAGFAVHSAVDLPKRQAAIQIFSNIRKPGRAYPSDAALVFRSVIPT